ncbi:hypothetical protein PFISCL1PPCAC_5333, partial [Pristionchus fissidentatus]
MGQAVPLKTRIDFSKDFALIKFASYLLLAVSVRLEGSHIKFSTMTEFNGNDSKYQSCCGKIHVSILAKILTIINVALCIPAIKAAYDQEDRALLAIYLALLLYSPYAVFRKSSGFLIPVFIILGLEISWRFVEFLSIIGNTNTQRKFKGSWHFHRPRTYAWILLLLHQG